MIKFLTSLESSGPGPVNTALWRHSSTSVVTSTLLISPQVALLSLNTVQGSLFGSEDPTSCILHVGNGQCHVILSDKFLTKPTE